MCPKIGRPHFPFQKPTQKDCRLDTLQFRGLGGAMGSRSVFLRVPHFVFFWGHPQGNHHDRYVTPKPLNIFCRGGGNAHRLSLEMMLHHVCQIWVSRFCFSEPQKLSFPFWISLSAIQGTRYPLETTHPYWGGSEDKIAAVTHPGKEHLRCAKHFYLVDTILI